MSIYFKCYQYWKVDVTWVTLVIMAHGWVQHWKCECEGLSLYIVSHHTCDICQNNRIIKLYKFKNNIQRKNTLLSLTFSKSGYQIIVCLQNCDGLGFQCGTTSNSSQKIDSVPNIHFYYPLLCKIILPVIQWNSAINYITQLI